MPKNVTIRPYPTTGFPSIEFINATGNAVKLNVKDDGSIVFSGVTYGDNLVTLTADGTKLIVKGRVSPDFEAQLIFIMQSHQVALFGQVNRRD